MSQSPYIVRNVRFGAPLGANIAFEDSLWVGLVDTHCQLPMGSTAEKLGEKFAITREAVDKFALRSQSSWKKGIAYCHFFFLLLFVNLIFFLSLSISLTLHSCFEEKL